MSELKNDRIQNIKMFKNIEKTNSFSKYSEELNRIFGDRSFNKFYFNLIMNKRNTNDNYFKIFQKTKSNFHPIRHFNIDKYKKFLTDLEDKEQQKKNFKNRFKFRKNEYSYDSDQKSNSKEKKIKLSPIVDIGRYNPNYDSIRKNQPRILFSQNGFKNIKLKKNYSEDRKKFLTHPIKSNIKSITINNFKTINTFNKKKKHKNNSEILSQELKHKKQISDKSNHALKFSDYSKRKPLINESSINSNSSCSNPNIFIQKNIKGFVELNRMSHKYYSFIPKKDKIPPLGSYDPKYSFTQTRSPNFFINKRPKIIKQMKLKKILCECNVPLEYELITNLNF